MNILAVDDEESLLELIVELGKAHFDAIYCAQSVPEAKEILKMKHVDAILSDVRMPREDGKSFLADVIREYGHRIPFVFMTGFADITPEVAFDMGAVGLVLKPFRIEEVIELLHRVVNGVPETTAAVPGQVLDVPVNYDTLFGSQGDLVLGRGGLFVAATGPLPPIGQVLQLEARREDTGEMVFSCIGMVRWTRGNTGKKERPGFGLELLAIPKNFRQFTALKRRELKPVSYIPVE